MSELKGQIQISADDFEAKYISRASFDEMKKRAKAAENIIRGMFPMWIAAMTGDLVAMRNYFNGVTNPLTSDDIQEMVSLMPDKEN